MRKRLPIGESNFENLIKEGFLYVDKTKYIYNLITSSKYYFLSRPRRFGKSLLISTLEQIFKGNKKLFEGLYIYNTDYDWKDYCVLRIDLNEVSHQTSEILSLALSEYLFKKAKEFEVEISGIGLKEKLIYLVENIYKKYKKEVVILIDEYDKPIITHLGRGDDHLQIAIDNRSILKEFYGTLKSASVIERLRFVLLTGVSKFSKAGVFSDLNNLSDLTMDNSYAGMLGITDDEIDIYFRDYMLEYADSKGISYEDAREEIRKYYNGYRFSRGQTKVYNPFSVVNLFAKKELANYWFESGTPTFLVNLIKEKNYNIAEAEDYSADETIFTAYEIEDLQITALLFQTGYLTIKNYDPESMRYTLTYPNLEVKNSFLKLLYKNFSRDEHNLYMKIYHTLLNGEVDNFIAVIESIFASIPYDEGSKLNEANFHTLFYLMVSAGGLPAQSQVLNYSGRIDMVVELKNKVYIFEFKCNQSAEEAINQIIKKDYPKKYINAGKEVYIVGINFDSEKRNIEEFKYKLL